MRSKASKRQEFPSRVFCMRKGPFSFEGSVPSYTFQIKDLTLKRKGADKLRVQKTREGNSCPFEEGIHVSLLRLG